MSSCLMILLLPKKKPILLYHLGNAIKKKRDLSGIVYTKLHVFSFLYNSHIIYIFFNLLVVFHLKHLSCCKLLFYNKKVYFEYTTWLRNNIQY